MSLSVSDSVVVGHRDAFHAPCVNSRSNENLKPGDHVQFTDDSFVLSSKCLAGVAHGVVYPFHQLENGRASIKAGSQFWVMMNPQFVGKVAHHFDINVFGLRHIKTDAERLAEKAEKYDSIADDYQEYVDSDDGCRGCW